MMTSSARKLPELFSASKMAIKALIAILEALKSSGSLRAELVII